LVRVLVVDDFQPWHKFIASVLHSDSNYTVVAFASDGLEAIKLCREVRPELIVMDINLPNCSGITAAEEIRRLLPHIEIVFFTRDVDHEFVQAALNLRAKGIVAKNDAHNLLRAVTTVMKGEQYLSEEVLRNFRSIDSGEDAE